MTSLRRTSARPRPGAKDSPRRQSPGTYMSMKCAGEHSQDNGRWAERLGPREDCGAGGALPAHGSPGRNQASLQIPPLARRWRGRPTGLERSVSDEAASCTPRHRQDLDSAELEVSMFCCPSQSRRDKRVKMPRRTRRDQGCSKKWSWDQDQCRGLQHHLPDPLAEVRGGKTCS